MEARGTGRYGERIARAYLSGLGHRILAVNQRFGRCEVDIITQNGSVVVFVEVKARSTDAHGYPEAFVDARKVHCLFRAAEEFLLGFSEAVELRFDIISIRMDPEGGRHALEHFRDAFFGWEVE